MGSVTADDGAAARPAAHRYLPLALGVAAAILVVDQLTKWWAEESLADRTIDLVWTLRLHLVLNRAGAFSIGDGLGPAIGLVALVVVGVLLWSGRSIGTRLGAVGLGMVLGGALGNILDRALRSGDGFLDGAVIDWIDLQWWPVFNVADMGVVIGAFLLFAGTVVEERRDAAAADASEADAADGSDADGADEEAGAEATGAGSSATTGRTGSTSAAGTGAPTRDAL